MPTWLSVLSAISLLVAAGCSARIVADLVQGHKQPMWIMNLVWPITALWAGPIGLWAYRRIGRPAARRPMTSMPHADHQTPESANPAWQSVALGTSHCGAGCTLGDIIAESFLFFFPTITLAGATIRFELFGEPLFAAWIVDYVLAFLFGIAFQYFTIKPMRNLSVAGGLVAAIKVDALSLTAWQVGMYGWMALATFVIFDQEIPRTSPVFWFMMQIAMFAGFATSYPVNWWLIKAGIKEAM